MYFFKEFVFGVVSARQDVDPACMNELVQERVCGSQRLDIHHIAGMLRLLEPHRISFGRPLTPRRLSLFASPKKKSGSAVPLPSQAR